MSAAKKQPKKPHPNSKCTPETTEKICGLIIEGKSLRSICDMEGMPTVTSVMRWLSKDEQFREHYARAREIQAELLANEIIDIADEASRDTIMTDNGPRENSEWISRSKLRIDARKWVASKLLPKKYGDKQEIEHSGSIQLTPPSFYND